MVVFRDAELADVTESQCDQYEPPVALGSAGRKHLGNHSSNLHFWDRARLGRPPAPCVGFVMTRTQNSHAKRATGRIREMQRP